MELVAYNSGLLGLTNGSIAFASDGVYAVLLDDGYTFSAGHSTYSDISGDEIEDADYDPVALAGKAVALSGSDVVFDCNNISFGSEVTIAAASVAFVKGNAASPQAGDELIWHADFGETLSSTNAQFVLQTPNALYEIAPNGS